MFKNSAATPAMRFMPEDGRVDKNQICEKSSGRLNRAERMLEPANAPLGATGRGGRCATGLCTARARGLKRQATYFRRVGRRFGRGKIRRN
jgi:hypothetical protein